VGLFILYKQIRRIIMPVIGEVVSVALVEDRSKGTVYHAVEPTAVAASVAEVVDKSAAEREAAINARFSQLEGALGQVIGLLQAQAEKPVVAEPLTQETVRELTPAEKAAATRAANKAKAEEEAAEKVEGTTEE
jgi:hypothetical protein